MIMVMMMMMMTMEMVMVMMMMMSIDCCSLHRSPHAGSVLFHRSYI